MSIYPVSIINAVTQLRHMSKDNVFWTIRDLRFQGTLVSENSLEIEISAMLFRP